MKKFLVIFALFCAVFLVSCGSDEEVAADQQSGNSDTVTDNDSESPDSSSQDAGKTDAEETVSDNDSDAAGPQRNEGELYGECYPNNTCNEGLVCDTENNICIKDKSSGKDDSDNSDPTDDKDSGKDKNDAEPQPDEDSGDPQPDEDTGNENDDNDNASDDDTAAATDTAEAKKCAEAGGNWNAAEKECTKTADCPDKPANSVWNDGKEGDESGKFTQTLTDSGWYPQDNSSIYSLNAGECKYKCIRNFVWDQTKCKKQITIGNICTGQIQCYNKTGGTINCPTSPSANFYGQDPQYTDKCLTQSFTIGTESLEGTVFDNNTLLTWEQSPSENTYIWENAHEHCDDLNKGQGFAGIKTWRLPNPLEILSIADNRVYNPSMNISFTGMPSGSSDFLWTSKDYQSSNMARAFNPLTGWLEYGITKTKECRVLCVSGTEMLPATEEDFVTSDDGKTITDKKTGLMWQSVDGGASMTWQQALAYCQSLNTETEPYAGYTDWRLPNRNELASLLDHGKLDPYFSNFTGLPTDSNHDYWLWSSSTVPSKKEFVWNAHFYHGSVYFINKTHSGAAYHTRCVRNAE